MNIQHQFLDQPWFIPNWECRTLILGSFNPSGGQLVDYFYGRDRNKFWKAVATLLGHQENHFHQGLTQHRLNHKLQCLQSLGWGCTDIIREVEVAESFTHRIVGNGYTDQSLFNVRNVSRKYNVSQILERLDHGDVKRVVVALGRRNDPAEYAEVKRTLIAGCHERTVEVYDDSVSFSARSRASVPELARYLHKFIRS
jgi:hypothetical protein